MKDIGEQVKAAGVVGAGGAGFPTHIKLAATAEIFIVNGAECEPMLKTDQQLASRYPHEIIEGLKAAMLSTGAREGIIALKAKYQASIERLKPRLQENMRIAILPDIYPAGDEALTIWLTTGRRVPPGGIPLDIGVVVNNVQTILNIAHAIRGQSVMTRTLTVTGAVKEPKTITVPIGTALSEILELSGGIACSNPAYILGGPMMGRLVTDLSEPVTKITGGLIVLPADHALVRRKQSSLEAILRIAKTVCEQCSQCTELCPRYLLGHELSPHMLIRAVNYNKIGNPKLLTSALICSECGVCEAYACPVGISPMRVNIALKTELRAKGIKYSGYLKPEKAMAQYRLIPSSRLAAKLGIKQWYAEAPLQDGTYEPREVKIPLKQHIGSAALPIVKEGEVVQEGQLIGEIPEGALGARVHASISGTIVQVSPQSITIGKGGGQK